MDHLKIIGDFQTGVSTPKLAQMYGVTHQRIQQILKQHNVARTEGGRHLLHKKSSAIFNQERDARVLLRSGCVYSEYKTIPSDAKRAYQYQKRNAKKRGIPWGFNVWTWWCIWRDSGKWEERGRGLGYCMTRKGNAGVYEPGNVYICTGQQSILDYYASDLYQQRKKVCTD